MTIKTILSFIVIVGVACIFSLFYCYVLKYKFIGRFWGVFIVSICGGILGYYLLKDISKFFIDKFSVNILAVIIGVYVSIILFYKVTPK